MKTWFYFDRPLHKAFHDLTERQTQTPSNLRSLLGMGLKFCPTEEHTTTTATINRTLERLSRDLRLKGAFGGSSRPNDSTFNKRMYIRSKWIPGEWTLSNDLSTRINKFCVKMKGSFRWQKKLRNNLLPHQCHALRMLRQQSDIMVVQCDKNLGPVIIEYHVYVSMAFRDHLGDTSTYVRLTPEEAEEKSLSLYSNLQKWIRDNSDILTTHAK